jgi:hypothetical protein
MPIMFGFARRRHELLEAELQRILGEVLPFGALRMIVTGDLARGQTKADTELELVIVQITDEPFHRRSDFWVTHLRPRVGTRFLVYTPEEFDELAETDPVLLEAQQSGVIVIG